MPGDEGRQNETPEAAIYRIAGDIRVITYMVTELKKDVDDSGDRAKLVADRVNALESWHDSLEGGKGDEGIGQKIDHLLQWRDEMRGAQTALMVIGGTLSFLSGMIGAVIATATGLANLLGGKHP